MHLLIAALLVAADQASKWWAKSSLAEGGGIDLALGFRFTYIRNTGAAFGLLRDLSLDIGPVTVDGTLLLGLLSALVTVLLSWYLVRRGSSLTRLTRIALVLVLAGAAGNMIDRLLLGYVIDFIHFRWGSFDFWVFNLADSFVVSGGILLFLSGLFDRGERDSEVRNLAEPDFFGRLDRHDS